MYAVVNTGGKQAKVETGTLLTVEKIDAEIGTVVTLPVLTIADDERLLVLPSELTGAVVSAEIVDHFLGDKQIIFKFQKRKGYKRKKGHRQMLTNVRITDISLDGKPTKAVKAEAPKKEKAEKAAPAEAAPEAKTPASEAPKASAVAAEAQCAAVKSDGTQCTNKAKEGSQYCGVHAKKYEG